MEPCKNVFFCINFITVPIDLIKHDFSNILINFFVGAKRKVDRVGRIKLSN